jgi:hypothetical protein
VRYFHQIAQGIDVRPVLEQLDAQPELWDQLPFRRTAPGTPHSQMTDIWLRFRPAAELIHPWNYAEPFHSVFYPAWRALPALHPITFALMSVVRAVELGGILITRIPPGGIIEPHDDRGRWHAEFHNCKLYVPLRSNEQCINICEDEQLVMRPGEAWMFNNLLVHSVENRGDSERITLIISMRVEQ